jgi:hypothetical protein
VDDSPHVGDVDVDIVDAVNDFPWRCGHFDAMRLNDEEALARPVSVEAAELDNDHLAGDSALNAKLEEVAAVRGTGQQVDLVCHLRRTVIPEYPHQLHPSRVPHLQQGLVGSVLVEQRLKTLPQIMEELRNLVGVVVPQFSVGVLGHGVEGHVVDELGIDEVEAERHLRLLQ